MARTQEANIVRFGAAAAVLMAISAFVFFALFNSLSGSDPRVETGQFMSDVANRQGLAAVVSWLNPWLGFLTIPLYLGLYYGLRRFSTSYMLLSLITGLAWGILLIVVGPLMFTLFLYVAPAFINNADAISRGALMQIGTMLAWIVGTTIGGPVFFLRALSVLATCRVMLLLGGRFWTAMAGLGILFTVEHFLTGTLQVMGYRGAAGTIFGALGGVLLFVWLIGVGIGLARMRQEAEASNIAGNAELAQPSVITVERAG